MVKVFKAISIIAAALILLNCSGNTDKDYFQKAKENLDQANYNEALNNFQKLLEEYPKSEYAPEAEFEIGKLYHGKAIKGIGANESLQKGIEYYKMAYEAEPENPRSEKALFMIGFIQANELNQLEKAESTYKKFIEKYPNSELRLSAEKELENLGVPPEEILKHTEPDNG